MPPEARELLLGSWLQIGRTALLGVLAYVCLVLVLRVSGKRTLSKFNAFDFVVTVALGSCLATILLSKDTSLAQGASAFVVLAGMQFLVAWASVRYARIGKIVRSMPTLLSYRGEIFESVMRTERIADADLYAALRSAGLQRVEQADAIVMESDGSLSVIRRAATEAPSVPRGVQGPRTPTANTRPR